MYTELLHSLNENNIDAILIPSNDEFMGEYVPKHKRRLEFVTGFSGSNGLALISKTKRILFTDGRYLLQAKNQLDDFEIFDLGELDLAGYISTNIKRPYRIGFDAKLHTKKQIDRLISLRADITFVPLNKNPIDDIWHNKELKSKILVHKVSGYTKEEKISQIVDYLSTDLILIDDPASICWLLNIRGQDIPYNPIVNCYLLLDKNSKINLFGLFDEQSQEINDYLGPNIELHALKDFDRIISTAKSIEVDSPSYFFYQKIAGLKVINKTNPILLKKAIKDEREIEGIIKAHIEDGVAMVRFLHFIDTTVKNQVDNFDELKLAEILLQYRRQGPNFVYESFGTISSFAENGAIIHYSATPKTNKKIKCNGLYLVDSGGQYSNGGTTDVTRTTAIGLPTQEQKENFTRVLKGNIMLDIAKFPKGTSGSHLDGFARYFLWQNELDYAHGTGHGVGSFLSVHEGPHGISRRVNNVPLQPGMIVSNEPGYYKEGEYGIRIENLLLVRECSESFLKFETLTLVPIDYNLIDFSLLSEQEKEWLYSYHLQVINTLDSYLDNDVKEWLIAKFLSAV